MPNENSSHTPPANPERQPLPQPPMTPAAPQQNEMGTTTDCGPNGKESETIKLEKDIRSGERWIIGIGIVSVIMNVVIALIYFGQLKEMRKVTKASTDASQTAACALRENQRQFVSTLTQMTAQTSAQQDAANASVTSAKTATKQLAFLAQQVQDSENQASAHLALRILNSNSAADEPRTVTIDIVNVGNSVATEISEHRESRYIPQHTVFENDVTDVDNTPLNINPGGFDLDRGEHKQITFTVPRQSGKSWYGWEKLTYVNVFRQTQTTCGIVMLNEIGHPPQFRLGACPSAKPK